MREDQRSWSATLWRARTMSWRRPLWLLLAWIALGLAILGVVLPGLPTTPFVLVAAWAASQASPTLHAWLLRHRLFGPTIRDWQRERAVQRRAKWAATLTMLLCAVVMLWVAPAKWIAGVGCLVMLVVAVWLWQRPEPGRQGIAGQRSATER
jgi:uncharacterized membrane protein YbaN (DUF454 family)